MLLRECNQLIQSATSLHVMCTLQKHGKNEFWLVGVMKEALVADSLIYNVIVLTKHQNREDWFSHFT